MKLHFYGFAIFSVFHLTRKAGQDKKEASECNWDHVRKSLGHGLDNKNEQGPACSKL